MPPQFSLRGLMALVAFCAAVFVVSLDDGPMVAAGIGLYAIDLAMLCTAVLGVIFRRGEDRGFWAGFAVFGWSLGLAGLMAWGPREWMIVALLGLLPFAYIGGLVGRWFARGESSKV